MNTHDTGGPSATNSARPRMALADTITGILLLGSIVIAVLQPSWLIVPLRSAVEQAGSAAPFVFVVLCALTAPLHLNGVLVALATLFWPLPVAGALAFVGSFVGCVLTATLLSRLSGPALGRWANSSALLRRLSAQVARYPLLVGSIARIAVGSGMALEAFYVLTGYTRRHYLFTTTVGLALWVAQALVGVTVLRSLSQSSPVLALVVSIGVPLLTGGVVIVLYRWRAHRLTKH